MKVFYNGVLMAQTDWQVGHGDRGFTYGDGFFETMTAYAQRPRLFTLHLDRLRAALVLSRMDLSKFPEEEELLMQLDTLRKANAVPGRARVKLSCWRQSGGLYQPANTGLHYLLELKEGSKPEPVVSKVALARRSWVPLHPLGAFKRLSADEYVYAGLECEELGAEDILLCNQEGYLAEALYANLFWCREGIWYTPALNSGCIEGVMRRFILQLANEQEVPVQEGLYKPESLKQAKHLLCCNASGIRWYSEFNEQQYQTNHPFIQVVLAAWQGEDQR